MTLKHTSQQKSALGDEILDLLTQLSSRYGLTWRKISEEIKVGEGTLSRVYNLKKKGGRQLLGALILLKKVIELENTVAGRAPPETHPHSSPVEVFLIVKLWPLRNYPFVTPPDTFRLQEI
jgi:hypothetical protein